MALISGLILLIVFAAGVWLGYTILFPVIEASRGKMASFRLCTADFFSLTLVLVLPAMAVGALRRRGFEFKNLAIFAAIAFAVSIWIWTRGVAKLSAIGVTNSLKRFVFLGIVLPVAILSSVVALPGLFILFAETFAEEITLAASALPVGVIVVGASTLIVVRKLCVWVVSPDSKEAKVDGEPLL